MALARYQFTVTDEAGNVIPAASVEVRRESNGTIVPLFSDRAGVVSIGNPFSADSDGYAAFHVVGGPYRITATSGAFSREWRYVGIGLTQETDAVAMGMTFVFSATTTDADPGDGMMRFNNASLPSVTAIYIDNLSAFGTTVSSWIDTFDDEGESGDRGVLTIMTNDAAGVMVARITGTIVDGTGYRKVTVAPIATSGTFSTGATVNVQFNRSATDGSNAGLLFNFDSSTSMADPGTGDFRLNNAALASVTAIAVDDTSSITGNPDVSVEVLAWDDSDSSPRGTLTISRIDAPENFAIYNITGASTDNSGWTQLAVTHVASSGSFTNGAAFALKFSRAGNRGTNGIDGITPGIPFTFSTTTSMADPGAGIIRLNNATLSSVTAAAVDDTSAASGNPDVSALVLSWDDSTSTTNRGYLMIKKTSAVQNFAVYRITGASTDNSGWTQLALTYVTHAGSFSDTDPVTVEFSATGDLGATGAAAVGKLTVWVPAAAMVARATSGAGVSTYDSGSNDVTIPVLDFDTTTQEYAHFCIGMPKSWDEGTVTFIPYWTNTAGSSTQTVAWTLAGVSISNDDALNASMGTAQTSSDTWLAQNDLHIGPESSAITIAGTPAENDLVVFQISRDVANDNMTGDAKLIGIKLLYTTNAATDA